MPSFRIPFSFFPLAALAFTVAFIGFEHFNGGVKTHHFLARADLPGFSNWLSLLILPVLGIIAAVRAKSLQASHTSSIQAPTLIASSAGSLVYGAALAASFLSGFELVSLVLFAGLLLLSIALPVHRAEYIFGFVTGMTIAFGSVILTLPPENVPLAECFNAGKEYGNDEDSAGALHAGVQAGSCAAGDRWAEHCGGGQIAGRGGADAVQLGQG